MSGHALTVLDVVKNCVAGVNINNRTHLLIKLPPDTTRDFVDEVIAELSAAFNKTPVKHSPANILAIPADIELSVLSPKPNEVLSIKLPDSATDAYTDALQRTIAALQLPNKVIITHAGSTVSVIPDTEPVT